VNWNADGLHRQELYRQAFYHGRRSTTAGWLQQSESDRLIAELLRTVSADSRLQSDSGSALPTVSGHGLSWFRSRGQSASQVCLRYHTVSVSFF
jgi:hypothetical protein